MTHLLLKRGDLYGYLIFVILISYLQQTNRIGSLNFGVLAAPPKNITHHAEIKSVVATGDENVAGKSNNNLVEQKTADLTLLINETLKINNKSTDDGLLLPGDNKPNFRDDWTFDRVEYDLMDFLQELNARYRYTNKTQSLVDEESKLSERQDLEPNTQLKENLTKVDVNAQTSDGLPSSNYRETVTKTTIELVKKELDAIPNEQQVSSTITTSSRLNSMTYGTKVTPSAAASSILPISLASGDHDISESTWQYGIFDRFTRPRASTTTTQAPDTLLVSGSNANFDVKSFNSDECGLRSYRVDPDYYPIAASSESQQDMEEMTKELSQRRQRPPLGAFFSSHKKYHQTSGMASDAFGDELDRDRPVDSLPPFDRYGEPATGSAAAASSSIDEESNTTKYHKAQAAQAPGSSETHQLSLSGEGHLSAEGQVDSPTPAAENEFNLSLRRQWLQQQLGSTLQILGFNASGGHNSLGDYFNKTGPLRENMMKMSASKNNKLGKSYTLTDKLVDVGAKPSSQPAEHAAELSEQELKARQDELKLEARVIGGNDARLGDSPWSASLQALVSRPGTGGVEYRHYCGGTIISEYYILTAAHCLDFMVGRESRLFVVVGDLNWRMSAASLHGRRFGIEKLIIHGGYKSTAFGHDIGLIKTKESMKPLKVNGRYIINSVCLPERNVEHTGEAELVGWGLFSNRNEMADSLQIADVPILPRPLCVDLYRRRTGLIQWLIGIELITEKQVCAGTFGRGICQGDSGSALVFNEKVASGSDGKPPANRLKNSLMRDHQQRATIIGVVAFGGIRRCSYQSLPGVYMQTSKYLDWILPRIQ